MTSRWHAVAERNFLAGRWSVGMLAAVRDAGRITEDEYRSLLDAAVEAGRISQADRDGALGA